MAGFASVVLVEPSLSHLDRGFTYALGFPAHVGALVRVPFRGKNRRGVVVALLDEPDVENALPAKEQLGPGLDEALVDVCRWVGARYLATLGESLAAAMPGRVASEETEQAPAPVPPITADLRAIHALRNGAALSAAIETPGHRGFVWRPPGAYADDVVALCGRALASGRGVLVLVPEVRLRTDLTERIGEAFGDSIARLGSDRTARERYRDWLAVRTGAKRIAIGGRGAVFAPLRNLGLIVVDDESHPSYKDGRAPRFHARTVAAERARRAQATLVLIGLPPSVEARAAADGGPYALVSASRGQERASRPPVTVVDERTRLEPAGRTLAIARAALDAGDRVVVLAHRSAGDLDRVAERSVRILRARAPARLDASTSRTEVRRALAKADVIVASPVIAKDIRLDGVGVLAIVGADAALAQPEFRAAEEAFATWWRAARWAGRMVVESRRKDHAAIVAITRWDPDVLYRQEASRRRELGYPPFASVARVDVPTDQGHAVASQLASLDGVEVLGPVDTEQGSVVVVRARRRASLLDALRPLVDDWRTHDRPMRVDVDPWEVLGAKWRS